MAGEPIYALVLLGLNIDQLSMNALSIPYLKKILRESTFQEAQKLVQVCQTFSTAKEVETYVHEQMANRFLDDFLMKL
jgi:phosphotransferase system enzyme I (PtsI)